MKTPAPPSFTLVELLVVVSIIGLLAGLAIPAVQGGLTAARKAESVNQLKQLGTLAVAYTAENSGSLPEEGGEGLQGFTQLGNFTNAWYNVLPPMAGFLAASNYLQRPAGFYEKGSLFFLKGAKYPANRNSRAYFAYGINSQLEDPTSPANTILNMNRIRRPSKTALFAEARLPDETSLPPTGGRSDALGQPKVRDLRFVSRHRGHGIVVFCDGHAESIRAATLADVTNPSVVIWNQQEAELAGH